MPATAIKPFKSPWNVGGQKADDIEVRAPLLEDMLAAENEANPVTNPNAYTVAMAACTTVRAGNFTGPFTMAHFKKMKPSQWNVVRDALAEAEQLGEAEPSAQVPTT